MVQVAKLLGEKWRALAAASKAEFQAAAAQQAASLKQRQQQEARTSYLATDCSQYCNPLLYAPQFISSDSLN